MKFKIVFILFLLSSILFIPSVVGKEIVRKDTLAVSSPVFKNNGTIPSKYTCDGVNINPPLFIEHVPAGAKSLALIVDDPDAPAGIWVHWVLWNIHPETKEIRENSVPNGAQQGMNDFRKRSYGGPCPPSGTHSYIFIIYALNTEHLEGVNKRNFFDKVEEHILDKAVLKGLNKRK